LPEAVARLRELSESLGTIDPTVNRILQGRSPEEAAIAYISGSALKDSASFAAAVEEGYLSSGDPTIPLAEALTPLYLTIQQQVSGVQERESELNALLARARFALHGEEVPPDATFSLRIADGVVSGYPYNGTMAAPYTTFFGMFDHYHSYGGEGSDWDLPENWFSAPETFDRTVQVNLVSTNDITGGNSGSPLLNKDLEIVGLIFDSNIDALVNTYIYLDDRGRAVAVDSRGILEALDDLYEADRIVNELKTGAAEDSSR
ncbi:MAG: S46 family peptidase, partial [Rhodothermales bacterium]